MQYREVESSSDEEDDPVNDVHPEFFPLDGNNNLEDDSSVSEDLDVEWRYAFDNFLHQFERLCCYYFGFGISCQKCSCAFSTLTLQRLSFKA